MKDRWHIVLTRAGQELFIAAQLQYLDGFVPLYKDPLSGRVLPFVSRYVFARWDADDPYLWHDINNINHVYGFIGSSRPVDVVDPIVDKWYADSGLVTLDEKKQSFLRGFGPGDLVKMLEGPFAGNVGVCLWVNDAGVRIKMGLLGREIDLYVALDSVAALGQEPSEAAFSKSKARRVRRKRQIRGLRSTQIYRTEGQMAPP